MSPFTGSSGWDDGFAVGEFERRWGCRMEKKWGRGWACDRGRSREVYVKAWELNGRTTVENELWTSKNSSLRFFPHLPVCNPLSHFIHLLSHFLSLSLSLTRSIAPLLGLRHIISSGKSEISPPFFHHPFFHPHWFRLVRYPSFAITLQLYQNLTDWSRQRGEKELADWSGGWY